MSLDDVTHHEWLLTRDLDALRGAAFNAEEALSRDQERTPEALRLLRHNLVTTLCAVEALTAARHGAGLSSRTERRTA